MALTWILTLPIVFFPILSFFMVPADPPGKPRTGNGSGCGGEFSSYSILKPEGPANGASQVRELDASATLTAR
jgi:hypothetical protein